MLKEHLNFTNINTLQDLYDEINRCHNIHQIKTTMGQIFEELITCTFELHNSFKGEYKNIWLYNEIPDELKTQLNLPSVDHDIDL